MTNIALTKFMAAIAGSLASVYGFKLAEVQQSVPPEWIEGGALAALIGSLSLAVVTLWRTNQGLHKEQRERTEKVITEQQERESRANRTNQELLEALRRLGNE